MNEDDLLRYLDEEARQAHHYSTGDLGQEREKAFRAYSRELYGNEEEGRSSIVASDVFDAVEGMLPDLLEVFTATDSAVEFEPVGPEDEEGAAQATAACNYVFYKQNNGFLILYTAIKDALMLKTGGVKWYWDKRKVPSFTYYAGVDEMQLAVYLTANPDAEVMEQEEVDADPAQMVDAEAGGFMATRRFNVKIKTVKEAGKVCITPIPPEELHISHHHDSVLLDDCQYVAHVSRKTLSDILGMGFDVTADDVKAADNLEYNDDLDDERGWHDKDEYDDNEIDPSMVRGYLREEYVLVDFDGDGIAERRRIIRLGKKILENKECSHVQIAAWTPYILTHRFDGFSVADLVQDFQRINTEIWRQQLDNLWLANNQETVVLTDSSGNPKANIDDLLNRRPGGVIRESSPGAVRPFVERWQGIEALPMIEQINVAKENRTGYTRYSQGLDADSLNKTARGVSMIMNASQKRMKLMARIIAECLMKPMFRGIFKTLTDYGMEKLSMRLNGKFVQYDPQEWRDGYDMTVNVGLGTGDKVEQQQMLMTIAQAQAAVAASPFAAKLLKPKNVYNLQAKIAENAGFKSPEMFWTDPDTVPDQPPPPNPQIMVEQAKLQAKQQESQISIQTDREKHMLELQFKAQQAELDRQIKLQIEAMKVNPPQNAEMMNQVLALVQNLSAVITAPKRIVRAADGSAIGVEPVLPGNTEEM